MILRERDKNAMANVFILNTAAKNVDASMERMMSALS